MRILRGAQAAILILTALGWVLSYSALQALAERHGYPGWESWLLPLTVDLLALSCALLGLQSARRGQGPTGEAWALAGVAALVTLGGNTASSILANDPIAVVLRAWPAICMLGAWHLYFRSIEPASVVVGLDSQVPNEVPRRRPRRRPAKEQIRVLKAQAAEHGQELTGAAAARATGVTRQHAARVLRGNAGHA